MPEIELRPLGDCALLAVVGSSIDMRNVERCWSLSAALRTASHRGVLDVVPSYASVLVRFDPFAVDLPRVMSFVRGVAERAGDAPARPGKVITLGVAFGGQYGVDFERAAHELGMRERRFRDAFCAPRYRVAFLGFLAGFPYLIGLPEALALPRLASPRPRVPAGSVATAAGQCGIYPRQSPGGWRLLGRTLAPLFDPRREAPALFAPGDTVRFEPVDAIERTVSAEFERASA
jgi:KipI family sensor histidine kinase inhibitor